MHVRLSLITVALLASSAPTWANTSNVDVYGKLNFSMLPTHETFASARDLESGIIDPSYIPQISSANNTIDPATISGNSHTASAQALQGSNHVYMQQVGAFSPSVVAAYSDSTWYDQVTIAGGTGMGTVHFSVQLSGMVDVGAFSGIAGYVLSASNLHPSQGTSIIASWGLIASPYNDPFYLSGLFAEPGTLNGAHQILTPGGEQSVNVTLNGTFNFTYGDAFYLLGSLHSMATDLSAFLPFCATDCPPTPAVEGTGATTLDFSNSANLISIALPEGATASFSSGTAYTVTAVPEPAEWLMLLAGLGLVGWRTQRHA